MNRDNNKKSIYKIIAFALFLIIISNTTFSQPRPEGGKMGGSISGQVIDSVLNKPIEYATIILFSKRDSSQVTGTSTNESGNFELVPIRPGRYYMQISFLGYELKKINEIAISRDNRIIDLGKILLNQSSQRIDGIRVESEKPAMVYKIDKKVINVEKHYTAAAGTAVDVLENTPSVTVDFDGNIELRGSTSFTVLIDGRPSILDPNDALEQIPASAIENIEIITNPSAKYDPDGTSGIINIITKKNKLNGTSAIVNGSGGFDHNYGGNFIINHKTKTYNAYINVDYNKRSRPGTMTEDNWTISNDTTFYVLSDGIAKRAMTGFGLKGGIDFDLTSQDNIGLGFRYGERQRTGGSSFYHTEWNGIDNIQTDYLSLSDTKRSGHFYAMNMNFLHKFAKKNHELSGQVIYSYRDMEEEDISEVLETNGTVVSGQINEGDGPATRWRFKLDYVLPIKEKQKLELGYQSRLRDSDDNSRPFEYNDITGEYEAIPEYNTAAKYKRNIHSLYALMNSESGDLGYQLGLRGEYTYRNIEINDGSQTFNIDRWDYFPTVHFSYRINENQQISTSYARKIKRPRGRWLEPFETRFDAYNIRVGNPDLKPEYIDSYELGFQKSIGRNMISAELYYRVTHNKVDFIRSVYAENVTLNSIENVGTDYSLGTELMINITLLKFWDMNLTGNLFHYKVDGSLNNQDFSNDNYSWNARLNNTFKFSQKTRLQINGRYRSESVTSQGTRKGFATADLALKHDFVSKVFSATFQVNDIFNSGQHESISQGTDFYRYSLREHKSPSVKLSFSYNFNNLKQKRERNDEDLGEDDF
ncbi:MAG: TonB-dependent receptor [candidate division Zixibacteria bacterium]|nr:TonB-dependent receptor [candidate division Zixibacteria bacterium]